MAIQAAQTLYNQATEIYGQAKAILDSFGDKPMPQEKANEVDTLFAKFDELTETAKRHEKAAERAGQMREINEPQNSLDPPKASPKGDGKDGDPNANGDTIVAMKAWNKLIKGGARSLSDSEFKALRADSDTAGGFLVAPQQVVKELIKAIDDMVFVRGLATVYPLAVSESLGVPVLDTDLSDPTWTSELLTGNDDTVDPFAKRELKPSPLAKRIKVSRKLLKQSTINVDALIRERMALKFGYVQENAFLTGSGTNQPLGLFTASTLGISTARDVATAGASAIVGDDLINTKYALKAAYWPKARWILNRSVLKAVRKLKDSANNYIWAPGLGPGGGLTGNLPATLVDSPFEISEFAPGTITTGLYTAILGDYSFYWIAEAMNLEIQVINELYAETNQMGYIARMELDGMPVHEEAFVRMRQA